MKEDLARLAEQVKEEGDNLRALEQFLARAGEAPRVIAVALAAPRPTQLGVRPARVAVGGGSEFHSGIDIGAPIGTEIRAPAPGTVVFAGRQAEYGVTLIIDHGNDTKSLYGHLSKLNVTADQKIQRGDLVALSGNTGARRVRTSTTRSR